MKKLAIGLGVLFVGLVAFGEVAYRKGWWVEPETEKIDIELTDEDLEALVKWGQNELMGRWKNERLDENFLKYGPDPGVSPVMPDSLLDAIIRQDEELNPNTLDQPPAEWEVQEQAQAEKDEYELEDRGGAN